MFQTHVIIPARGGSKRIPNKNIQLINGIPLIEITIKNLIESDLFQSITVSTDSEDIREISLQSGAHCPRLRPKEISEDFTPTLKVIQYEINNLASSKEAHGILCVYPTSVLIKPTVFHSAVATFWKKVPRSAFMISVAKYSHPIQRAITLDSNSRIKLDNQMHIETRTQDLFEHYFDAGQFYMGTKFSWIRSKSIFEYAYGFQLPNHSFIDIDQPEDLDELRRRLRLH